MPPPFFRIPVPVFGHMPAADHVSVAPTSTLSRRRGGGDNGSTVQIVVLVLGSIAAVIIFIFAIRHFARRYYRRRHNYKPTADREDDSPSTRQMNRRNQDNLEDALTEAQTRSTTTTNRTTTTTAGIDRNTSIRSVMTLPAYRPKPTETEQVLGREGERDGIDVVVEMQTAEEQEALRDEEMEALYQIRAARRRQIAEREERRRQRRDARDANDVVALRALRARTRESASHNTAEIEELRGEHERIRTETRQRAVSSVSYADLGVVRADGTRVRANSTESTERVGLLSDAASIGGASSLFRTRDRSASATLSIDTSRSMGERPESPGLGIMGLSGGGGGGSLYAGRTRSRASSAATTTRVPTPSPGTTPRAGSPPEIIDAENADLGDAGMPPPGYDEVSLDDITPVHSRRNSDVSGRASPYPDPPPDYPGAGPAEARNRRVSAHMEDLAAQAREEDGARTESSARSGLPRLPSLRLDQVPQIVIEPVSARPTSTS